MNLVNNQNSSHSQITAGIDEAGRGALAGPVVAGACILSCELFKRRNSIPHWSPFEKKSKDGDVLLADSKVLSPEERSMSYEWITRNCAWGVGIVSSDIIQEKGILKANHMAMQLALMDLRRSKHPDHLLIDGRDAYTFDCPHTSIIRGDQTEPCIAAASIIAKVTRDRLMIEYGTQYPEYSFESHKGYGSSGHIASIQKNGPCPIHRMYFLTRILTEPDPVLL